MAKKTTDIQFDERTHISVRGAREHNLKNISLDIPRDKLVVITGLSGSGKSSLAFDTLYAEGQRRYVECLSPYARQFLGIMKKPDIDTIEGLSPAISIEQKSVSNSPRSTVGTVTEVYDYLRLLFAKIGVQHCVDCHIPVQSQTPDQIIDSIMELPQQTRIQILTPLVRGRKGHYREVFEQYRRQGYTRVRVDGVIQEIVPDMQVSRFQVHTIDLVIDRTLIEPDQDTRISESIHTALKIGEGIVIILTENADETWAERLYSTANSCSNCGRSYESLAPNNFSFNSPFGACETCQGLGNIRDFDEDRVIPNRDLSVEDGGISILGKQRKMWIWDKVNAFAKAAEIDLTKPIKDLEVNEIQALLYGTKSKKVTLKYVLSSGKTVEYKTRFEGVLAIYRQQYDNTSSSDIRAGIEEYMSAQSCSTCEGGRLKPENLAVKIHQASITELTSYDVTKSYGYFTELESKLSERERRIGHLILKEITTRLRFLLEVGLHYLNLDRSARTLSGGESQRIRLASQIGSQLVGVMYVLDEPSIGLHQHDNQKLITSLKNLRDLGNSVIVVEHDREMIEQSDYLVDIGPKAGVHGGEIMFEGAPDELLAAPKSLIELSNTAQYLTGARQIEVPQTRREGNGKFITLSGARGNNLREVTLKVPLGTFTTITGMSGSGKSSLINETLYPILSKHFHNAISSPLPYSRIEGLEHIDKVIEIDQTPIGRTPRSNPATYTGVFTQIRDFFSQLQESKMRGYLQGRFSFNVKGGRCDDCEGGGIKKIEMNYLPDVYVQCETCGGKRYNAETCQVYYKEKNIADVLDMSIEEALEFFKEIPKIRRIMQTLYDVGLGYIKIGQQAPTLSGGEAQRVKLATELAKVSTGKTLYLLDEPTTGLHFEDIRLLLGLLDKLVEKGNTVVVIEHNLDVVKCADWVIDLGPEGGGGGGQIIAEGTPESVCKVKKSYTGKYLKKELKIK
ncbi:MAG: excinuclease ABC subunit UvrA [Candidatus Kapaibacterium sp.]